MSNYAFPGVHLIFFYPSQPKSITVKYFYPIMLRVSCY